MAGAMKKVLIVLGVFVLVGVLLFVALIAFVVVGDDKAKAKATALCGSAAVGTPADVALERARKADSASRDPKWRKAENGDDELLITFPAALPLTGYLCSISARDGIVTATHVYTVD
jgi:hypothetical protein